MLFLFCSSSSWPRPLPLPSRVWSPWRSSRHCSRCSSSCSCSPFPRPCNSQRWVSLPSMLRSEILRRRLASSKGHGNQSRDTIKRLFFIRTVNFAATINIIRVCSSCSRSPPLPCSRRRSVQPRPSREEEKMRSSMRSSPIWPSEYCYY